MAEPVSLGTATYLALHVWPCKLLELECLFQRMAGISVSKSLCCTPSKGMYQLTLDNLSIRLEVMQRLNSYKTLGEI